jgi:hypothetical protein
VVVLGAVAAGVAWFLQRRTRPAPQRGASWAIPELLNRSDFDRPDAPWLVAVFTSSTCLACKGTAEKAALLESDVVAVQRLDSIEQKDIHDRYGIDAVPMVLVADAVGTVRANFVGEPTATDLWAAVAELREPGTVPPSCTGDICD